MKTFFELLIAIFVLVVISSCSSDDEGSKLKKAEPILLRTAFDEKLEQDNHFAFDFFRTTYQNVDEPNIFVSPLSVSMALNMTMNGAKENTLTEMLTALRVSGYSMDEINEYSKTLREALLAVDPTTRINIANSIWSDKNFSIEQSFIDVNRNNYDAEIEVLDFSTPEAMIRINNWCAEKTNNKIPEIIEDIPGDMIMYLINAVYFKGIWKSQFDKKSTYETAFYTEDGQEQQVQMMTQKHTFGYAKDENCSYLELPYGNDAFSMIVILPDEDKTVNDVVENLNSASWSNAMKGLYLSDVVLHMPRFKVEAEYKLQENILPEMGMLDAFGRKADFSGINSEGRIFISEVKHKTYVEVNEEGTEAAAVTSVGFITTSGEPSRELVFRVNRPFLFVVKEQSTGVILFIGKIGKI